MKFSYLARIVQGRPVPEPEIAMSVAVKMAKVKPGALVRVTVDTATNKRTLDQNARVWALFESFGWERDEAHDYCCAKFLEPVVKEWPDGSREEIPRGTRNLSTVEFSEFMDRIERFLNEKGLWYPEA